MRVDNHSQVIGLPSAKGVRIFARGDGLQPGMIAEIVVAWPRLLDDRIQLQLMLQVTITSSDHGVAGTRIVAYDFRSAALSSLQKPAKAAKSQVSS